MKRLLTTTFLIFVFITSAFAQKPDSYSLEAGTKFSIHGVQEQTVSQDVPGQGSQTIINNQTTVDEFEVLSVDDDGGYVIKSTVKRRILYLDLGAGQTMTIDSQDAAPIALAYQKMVDKSFTFEMTKQGKIGKIEGLEAIKTAYKGELTGTPFAATVDQILRIFSDDYVTNTLSLYFDIYPEGGVVEEWTGEGEMVLNDMMMKEVATSNWDSDQTILRASKLSFSGNVDTNGQTIAMTQDGTLQTIIDLDKATGLTTLRQSILETTGKMTFGVDVPQTIEMKGKYEFRK